MDRQPSFAFAYIISPLPDLPQIRLTRDRSSRDGASPPAPANSSAMSTAMMR